MYSFNPEELFSTTRVSFEIVKQVFSLENGLT